MQVFQGRSFAKNAADAVAEAVRDWDSSVGVDIVFLFASTEQNAADAATAAQAKFPGVPVVGCTSTGENVAGTHSNGALVMAGLSTPRIRWAAACIDKLTDVDDQAVATATAAMFDRLGVDRDDLDPSKFFCLTFVDGLRLREEKLCLLLTDALEGISFVGGSAGDDLKFEETRVFFGGRALTDAAVLVLGRAESEEQFRIIKHQHFTTTGRPVAITRCDPDARRVYEIDGFPAIDAYARALGLTREQIDGDVTFMNPVTLSINGELYVRSIQKIEGDGSLVFYCGIEEGMVLDIGGHHDMVERLQADIKGLGGAGKAKFLLTCNCILRALEAKNGGHVEQLDAALQSVSEASIGFDTYGEQLNGLHINQTLVALALAA